MKNPKEQAELIIEKYLTWCFEPFEDVRIKSAKIYSLCAIDMIRMGLRDMANDYDINDNTWLRQDEYWIKVKQEILDYKK